VIHNSSIKGPIAATNPSGTGGKRCVHKFEQLWVDRALFNPVPEQAGNPVGYVIITRFKVHNDGLSINDLTNGTAKSYRPFHQQLASA